MDDIRTVVHGLYETVRKRLNELLSVGREDAMPALDLARLCDNAVDLSEGWNFLKDCRNQFSVDGERWMWRRMFVESDIETYFVKGGLDDVRNRDDIQWNQENIEDCFRVALEPNPMLAAFFSLRPFILFEKRSLFLLQNAIMPGTTKENHRPPRG